MLDEICGFILWFEALMNRKVMLVADLEKTEFANVYVYSCNLNVNTGEANRGQKPV